MITDPYQWENEAHGPRLNRCTVTRWIHLSSSFFFFCLLLFKLNYSSKCPSLMFGLCFCPFTFSLIVANFWCSMKLIWMVSHLCKKKNTYWFIHRKLQQKLSLWIQCLSEWTSRLWCPHFNFVCAIRFSYNHCGYCKLYMKLWLCWWQHFNYIK